MYTAIIESITGGNHMENDMAKENAVLDKKEQLNEDLVESFDFGELEEKLQSQLEEELADMQFLAEEKEKTNTVETKKKVISKQMEKILLMKYYY